MGMRSSASRSALRRACNEVRNGMRDSARHGTRNGRVTHIEKTSGLWVAATRRSCNVLPKLPRGENPTIPSACPRRRRSSVVIAS